MSYFRIFFILGGALVFGGMLAVVNHRRSRRRAPMRPLSPIPEASPAVAPPAQRSYIALTLAETVELVPALREIIKEQINASSVARVWTTLANSAIVPKAPWRPVPHRFESFVVFPRLNNTEMAFFFIFYQLT